MLLSLPATRPIGALIAALPDASVWHATGLRTTLAGFLLAAAMIVVPAWFVGIDDVVGSL